jgi:uncharacterized BrkB/YihY/UPF0761 family membrane protein
MEQQVKEIKKDSFWKKYKFTLICFLSSLPLLAFGIIAMIYLYTPQTTFIRVHKAWLLPLFACLYSVLLETIIVIIPLIMLIRKNKKDKKTVEKK